MGRKALWSIVRECKKVAKYRPSAWARLAAGFRPKSPVGWIVGTWLLALLALPLGAGCGGREPARAPAAAGDQAAAIPPAEMRSMLEGLRSSDPRMQYAALGALERFPAVLAAQREQVERLGRESRDPQVRRKAAELLARLSQAPGASRPDR